MLLKINKALLNTEILFSFLSINPNFLLIDCEAAAIVVRFMNGVKGSRIWSCTVE